MQINSVADRRPAVVRASEVSRRSGAGQPASSKSPATRAKVAPAETRRLPVEDYMLSEAAWIRMQGY